MKNPLFLIAFLCPFCINAQIEAFPLNEELPANAICYRLPKTALKIKVTTKCTTEKPGIYARYAERHLGIADVITQETVRHEIIAVQAEPYTLPDDSKRFYLQAAPPSQNKTRTGSASTAFQVHINTQGILQSINLTPTRKPHELPVSIQDPETREKCLLTSPTSTLTQEMQLAGSTSRVAELAAKQLFDLRDTRLSLLHGDLENIPQEGSSMKLFLEELNRMENYYLELFIGTRTESFQTTCFEYLPDEIPSYDILFRFSQEKGIVDKEDLSGIPIHFLVHKPSEKQIRQSIDSIAPETTKGKKEEKKALQPMLYYYYPHLSEISILNGQTVLYNQKLILAQFGDLMRLENTSPYVELNPETGGILRQGK